MASASCCAAAPPALIGGGEYRLGETQIATFLLTILFWSESAVISQARSSSHLKMLCCGSLRYAEMILSSCSSVVLPLFSPTSSEGGIGWKSATGRSRNQTLIRLATQFGSLMTFAS